MTDQPALKKYTYRLVAVEIGFLLLFAAAVFRLVQIQILDAGTYEEIARKQYEARVPLLAQRGNIHDRNGNVLVSNSQFVSFAADPVVVGNDARFIAEQFAKVTGRPVREYIERLQSKKRFVWLERKMRPDLAELIPIKKMGGVVRSNEWVRLYHYDELLGQVIGATNIDNVGMSGIEQQFNASLHGRDGFVVMQRDGLGRKRPSTEYPREEAIHGHSIDLTIDLGFQSIAEEELRKGIERTQAEAGLVVIMKPQTGEILALANYPPVNLNKISDVANLKNRVVSDMYEPGSVFKVVTASAALQHQLVTMDKHFYAENGKYVVPLYGNRFRTINDSHPMKDVTFLEAMAYSSNIVMAKVSDLIGPERLYNQARNFGFGMSTGIELPAEISGQLKKPVEWSGTTLNTMAYGYEIGVTPLQVVNAYAAIANGGVLMRPYIVKREVNEQGEVIGETEPLMIRRVMPRDVADDLKKMLVSVVEFGTGSVVKIPKVTIAGKTGTSRKYIDGKYETGSYNASFIGFFPVDNPELVCYVITEKPKVGYTGAIASAPIFKGIAERIINNSGLIARSMVTQHSASITPMDTEIVEVPDVTGRTVSDAITYLQQQGFQTKIYGRGEEVVRQYPVPGSNSERGATVSIMMDEEIPMFAGMQRVPDLRGMSIRRAVNKLSSDHLGAIVVGSGRVVSQFPLSGAAVKTGSRITVMCEPKNTITAQLY